MSGGTRSSGSADSGVHPSTLGIEDLRSWTVSTTVAAGGDVARASLSASLSTQGRARSVVCPPGTAHRCTRVNLAAKASFMATGTTRPPRPGTTSSGRAGRAAQRREPVAGRQVGADLLVVVGAVGGERPFPADQVGGPAPWRPRRRPGRRRRAGPRGCHRRRSRRRRPLGAVAAPAVSSAAARAARTAPRRSPSG